MSDEIEAVARAIYESRNGYGCKLWTQLPRAHKMPYIADAQAAIAALDNARGDGWRPIESAPRDGTAVLVRMLDDIFPRICPKRPDLERWNGVTAVMHNKGIQYSDWGFAAPVGMGGFPDEWMAGWMPIPAPLTDPFAEWINPFEGEG